MPHSHDHAGHDHGHSHTPPSNNAAFAIGVTLNIAFVIAEVVYGLAAHSLALLSDAGHNLSDVFGLLPGVETVHDLHIWGMSTTETALTAHLVMPQPPTDGRFLHDASHELHERFEIGHVTIQIEHGDAECHQSPAEVV